jgi:hypothetical protein
VLPRLVPVVSAPAWISSVTCARFCIGVSGCRETGSRASRQLGEFTRYIRKSQLGEETFSRNLLLQVVRPLHEERLAFRLHLLLPRGDFPVRLGV